MQEFGRRAENLAMELYEAMEERKKSYGRATASDIRERQRTSAIQLPDQIA